MDRTCCPGAAGHTRYRIEGTVIDSETGEPLAGASVYIAQTLLGAATDSDGPVYD